MGVAPGGRFVGRGFRGAPFFHGRRFARFGLGALGLGAYGLGAYGLYGYPYDSYAYDYPYYDYSYAYPNYAAYGHGSCWVRKRFWRHHHLRVRWVRVC
jgi:hypothetical protein